MQLIPAIDVLDGKIVRLKQGKRDQAHVYSDDPLSFARKWSQAGASYLHVVDLNGAFGEGPQLLDLCRKLASDVKVAFQIGGGIRSLDLAKKYIDAGADRLVVGTAAITDGRLLTDLIEHFGPPRVVVSIDVKNDRVMMKGWTEESEFSPLDFVNVLRSMGVRRILLTDISRDGMMQGPNIELINQVAREGKLALLASGGVSTSEDLLRLRREGDSRVEGVIAGTALYEGKIRLEDVHDITRRMTRPG